MPRLVGAGSRCHDKSNTLRQQQQQQLADILVQVPPNNYVPCCRVGGSSRGGGGWWWLYRCCCACIRFGALFSIFLPAQLLPLLAIYMCLRFRGCPVLLDIELSVSARYQKTRVLLSARRLLLLFVAAAAQISKLHALRVNQRIILCQSEHQNKNDFWRPTTAKLHLRWPTALYASPQTVRNPPLHKQQPIQSTAREALCI